MFRATLGICGLIWLALTTAQVQISFVNPSLPFTSDGVEFHLQVEGDSSSKVLVKSMKNAAGDTIISNQELAMQSGKFVLSLSKDIVQAGVYRVQVAVSSSEGENTSSTLSCRVTVPVEITAAKILGSKMKLGQKLEHRRLESSLGDKINAVLSVQDQVTQKPITPQQAVLRLIHQNSKESIFFNLKNEGTELKTVIKLGESAKALRYLSGTHELAILLGDSRFQEPITWELGTVDLSLAAAPLELPPRLYSKPLLYESDIALKPLPEIKHHMRPADPRPNIIVSTFFTLLILVPFVGYLLFLVKNGANMRLFPGGLSAFSTLAFFVALGSILVLFAAFWVQLTMNVTLSYLALLAPVTAVLGHRALSASASAASTPVKTKRD